VTDAHCSRGCAFGDFDNDGDVDILIVNLNEPPSLLRNDLKGNQNWIKVKLEGVKSNRSAIGARVLVRYGGKVQAQAVLSQSSFYSSSDPRLHLDLGRPRPLTSKCIGQTDWWSSSGGSSPISGSNFAKEALLRHPPGREQPRKWDQIFELTITRISRPRTYPTPPRTKNLDSFHSPAI